MNGPPGGIAGTAVASGKQATGRSGHGAPNLAGEGAKARWVEVATAQRSMAGLMSNERKWVRENQEKPGDGDVRP